MLKRCPTCLKKAADLSRKCQVTLDSYQRKKWMSSQDQVTQVSPYHTSRSKSKVNVLLLDHKEMPSVQHHVFMSANCGSIRYCLLHIYVQEILTLGDFSIGLSLCATLADGFGGRPEMSVPNTTTFCRRRFLPNPCPLYAPHLQFEDSQAL